MVAIKDRDYRATMEVEASAHTTTAIEEAEEIVRRRTNAAGYFWGLLRLSMGWVFFWAFIDKVFGLLMRVKDGASYINSAKSRHLSHQTSWRRQEV